MARGSLTHEGGFWPLRSYLSRKPKSAIIIGLMSLPTVFGTFSSDRTILTLCAVGALALVDLRRRVRHQQTHLLFAAALGTFLSVGLMETVSLLVMPDPMQSPF